MRETLNRENEVTNVLILNKRLLFETLNQIHR